MDKNFVGSRYRSLYMDLIKNIIKVFTVKDLCLMTAVIAFQMPFIYAVGFSIVMFSMINFMGSNSDLVDDLNAETPCEKDEKSVVDKVDETVKPEECIMRTEHQKCSCSQRENVLKINVINGDQELIEFYSNPKNYSSDSGVNIAFPADVTFEDECLGKIHGLGIKCEVNFESGYFLWPRSSISKTGVRVANSIGLIDQTYRGELKLALDVRRSHSFKKLESCVQIVAPNAKPIKVVVVNELSETERGSGGFGSTGK